MDEKRSTICPLPATVIAQIKSSTVINTLSDVVLGLLKNALDAQATRISIELSFSAGECKVEDNGRGVPASAFQEGGGLFKHYWTSKQDTDRVHGHTGTFLASLAALSKLTIESLDANDQTICSLSAENSRLGPYISRCSIQSTLQEPTGGTRIIVRDLFGNMPVRVKQRESLGLSKSGEMEREWISLQHELLSILLAWPYSPTLLVKDAIGATKLYVKPVGESRSPSNSGDWRRPLLTRLLGTLTHGGILTPDSWPSWVPIAASNSSYKVKGAISLNPVGTRRHQFLSIGIVPLQHSKHGNLLYDEINRVFAASRFGIDDNEAPVDEDELQRRSKDRRYKRDGFTGQQLQGGRRGIDRWPMFCLQVAAGFTIEQDLFRAGEKPGRDPQLGRLLDLLGSMVTHWLAEHHFRPQKWRSRKEARPGSSHRPRSATNVQVANANVQLPLERPKSAPTSASPQSLSRKRHYPNPSRDDEESPWGATSARPAMDYTTDGQLLWIHPVTKEKHVIDAQSGAILPLKLSLVPQLGADQKSGTSRSLRKPSLRLETQRQHTELAQTLWISQLLEEWDNPTFANCEETIACTNVELNTSERDHGRCKRHTSIIEAIPKRVVHAQASITGSGLQNAEVIAQLDGKFILIRLNAFTPASERVVDGDSSQLVLIDQHAADERIKVEELLRTLCSSMERAKLEKPLSFDLQQLDVPFLKEYAPYFRRWGIDYVLEERAQNKHHQLTVHALPVSILERCIAEPRLLIDLLRAESHERAETGRGTALVKHDLPEQSVRGRHDWLRQISDCPRGLVEMLNSRACRSAIMFNDRLSGEDCAVLIAKLSRCALPFQCAHGRPSMVLLTNASGHSTPASHRTAFDEFTSESFRVPRSSFASAYRSWSTQPSDRDAG